MKYIDVQLEKINEGSSRRLILEGYREKLKRQLQSLKQQDHEVQQLQIKDIFDRMGILFSAVHLLREADDQESKEGFSKLNCFDYFVFIHAQGKYGIYDREHLDRIQTVLEGC